MSAASATRPVALLRYALLLAGLLALILGLLGMHVVAGSHGMHAEAAPSAPAAQDIGHPAGHGTHNSTIRGSLQVTDATGAARAEPSVTPASVTPASAPPASVTIGGTEVPPSCVCQGGCAEKPTIHAGCTPSPAGASLSAPQPGSTFLDGESWTAVRADRPAGYAYLPGTPTPRDLSISRT